MQGGYWAYIQGLRRPADRDKLQTSFHPLSRQGTKTHCKLRISLGFVWIQLTNNTFFRLCGYKQSVQVLSSLDCGDEQSVKVLSCLQLEINGISAVKSGPRGSKDWSLHPVSPLINSQYTLVATFRWVDWYNAVKMPRPGTYNTQQNLNQLL